MYLPESYGIALLMMFITMCCWGSWANMQKATKNWRFELFYWDYSVGLLLFSIIFAFTMGSMGSTGTPFLTNVGEASSDKFVYALLSGAIFNIANILLVAAIVIAGLAVAFPISIGIALITGTLLSYLVHPVGELQFLIPGVILVLLAILLDAAAYKKAQKGKSSNVVRGIVISVISGILMGLFYPLLALSMAPPSGLVPYGSFVFFAIGLFICNIPVNSLLMRKPITGAEPVSCSDYFKGTSWFHAAGIIGGVIWGVGGLFNLLASTKAGPAVAYAFGQGSTLIAALWGVFVWREFEGVKGVGALLTLMFLAYLGGLFFIGLAPELF